MRPIKFRGKRVDNGEWVYGNLVYMHGLGDTWVTGIQQQSGDGYRPWASFEVDPVTVGQYAGLSLKDRDGKVTEIFEGDIVKLTSDWPEDAEPRYVPVKFMCCGFDVEDDFGEYDITSIENAIDYWEADGTYYEFVGNIHDNPNLLLEGR